MFKLLALVVMVAITAVVITSETNASRDADRGSATRAVASARFASTPQAPLASSARRRRCDRNYSGRCLRPNVSDYDCAGGSGNGPYYVRGPFSVVGNDHYRLDSDGDRIACES